MNSSLLVSVTLYPVAVIMRQPQHDIAGAGPSQVRGFLMPNAFNLS
jgi:hypothetical protein